jgi:hypothetical protein
MPSVGFEYTIPGEDGLYFRPRDHGDRTVRHALLHKFHVFNSKAKDSISLPNGKIYQHKFLFSALQNSSRNGISKVAISVFKGKGKKLWFHKVHCSELSFQMT